MKKLLTLYLILSALVSVAQNLSTGQSGKTIDSLLKALKNYDAKKVELNKNLLPDASDTTKVKIMNDLAVQYEIVADYASAKKYADDALSIAQQIRFKSGIAQAVFNIGVICNRQGNYHEALKNHTASLKIREEIGDEKEIVNSYIELGNVYQFLGNYFEAVKTYFTALKLSEKTGNKIGIARCYNNLGTLYENQGKYPEALKNYFASLKIKEEINDKKGIGVAYNNIGKIYQFQGNYPAALKYHFASLKIKEEFGDKKGISNSYNSIGGICAAQGNYDEALNHMYTALKIKEEIGDKNGLIRSRNAIGLVKVKLKMPEEGREWLRKGLQLAKEINSLVLIKESYLGLVEADSALGNFAGAYENYKLFILYRDSLNNDEITKEKVESQMQFEFDRKEASAKSEQEKKDIVQRNIRNSIAAGLAGTLFFLLVTYSQRNRIAREKKRSDELIIEKEMLMKEIHHRVKNNLEVISSLLELQTQRISDEKAKAAIIESQSRVQSISLIHHKLYQNEDVASVEFKNFISDLYRQIEGVFKKSETEVEFTVTADETLINTDTAVPLGLILNELITNTFKYGVCAFQKNRIEVSLKSENENNYKLIYRDNGKGLPADFNIQKSTSLGMKVIQLLTKQLGGKLNFYNDNGSVFEIPFIIAHKDEL